MLVSVQIYADCSVLKRFVHFCQGHFVQLSIVKCCLNVVNSKFIIFTFCFALVSFITFFSDALYSKITQEGLLSIGVNRRTSDCF